MASTVLFEKERYQEKPKKLADTIKRVNTPGFMPQEDKTKKEISFQSAKISTKLLGKAQRNTKVAQSRGFKNKDLLQYDFSDCSLFDKKRFCKTQKG